MCNRLLAYIILNWAKQLQDSVKTNNEEEKKKRRRNISISYFVFVFFFYLFFPFCHFVFIRSLAICQTNDGNMVKWTFVLISFFFLYLKSKTSEAFTFLIFFSMLASLLCHFFSILTYILLDDTHGFGGIERVAGGGMMSVNWLNINELKL